MTRTSAPPLQIDRPAKLAGAVLLFGVFCALLLALPGETVTTKYVNDLFIFLDGAHRISLGQVPNREFQTALGPLAFYIPAAGYWLTGDFGGAMPVGMALVVLACVPAAAHIVSSRLRPALALPIAAYLILILAMPLNPGENIRSLSFAMFYNRIGWAALGFLLLMYLRPARKDERQVLLDTFSAAFLTLLMLYSKISYGFVGLGFLVLMLLDSRQRAVAISSLCIVVGVGLAVESTWRSSLSHAADLIVAGRVSGDLGTPDKLGDVILRNLADYILFVLLAAVALWRTRSLRDGLFFAFCAASGFVLMRQNFQVWGIITLAAGAAVAAEAIARSRGAGARRPGTGLAAGVPLLLLAFVLPPALHNAAALTLHAGLAATRQGRPVPLPQFEGVRLAKLWSEGEYGTFVKYFSTLQEGAEALSQLGQEPSRVLVLDFVTPFSAGLGLEPPRGVSPWYHWSRTLDEANHREPRQLFRDVRVVMEPKWPIESWTADGMRSLYADHLAEAYELARETEHWRIYVAKTETAEALTQSVEASQSESLQ